jgi:superoxide dismutase
MTIDNHYQTISSHDLRAAIIELKQALQELPLDSDDWQWMTDELKSLQMLLVDAANRAGSPEQFLLIHDEFWKAYCEEYAEGIHGGEVINTWPCDHIDWDKAADALKQDYGQVDFGGATYWVRM